MSLTHERLRQLLDYDPETGMFTRLITTSSRAIAGDHPGYPISGGYIAFRVDGVMYLAHRIAWFWVTGEWPEDEIDHRDTDRTNNRWENLRAATGMQNKQNSVGHADALIPLKGVTWKKDRNKYRASIRHQHLGYFECPAAAHFAYLVEASKLYGEFARAA